MSTKHRHASGRWDRSLRLLSNDTERHIEAGARIVTGTEADQEKREKVLRALAREHGYYCQTGDGGTNDDCWALADKSESNVIYAANLPVESNRGGPSTRPEAVFMVLEDKATGVRILLTVMHLPHGVGLLDKLTTLTKRWRIEARDWHRQALAIAAKYGCIGGFMCGDWNVNLRSKRVRTAIAKEMPGVRFWPSIPAKGTHAGGRLIDFTVTFGGLRASSPTILPFTSASDHAAYEDTIAVTAKPAPKPAPKPKEAPVTRPALCPFAVHKLITPGANDPRIDQMIGAILHVDAGDATSLFDYFRRRSGGIESHFHVRKDGVIEQYRSLHYEADANYRANSFMQSGKRRGFVSIETQGLGSGTWNSKQLASIKRLLAWLSEAHDFPLRRTPGPFEAGVGYHTLFGAPGPWTPVSKSCPGPRRIKQFNNTLVPWMGTDTKDWFDMASKADLRAEVEAAIRGMKFDVIGAGGKTKRWTLGQFLHNIEYDQDATNHRLNVIGAKVDQILAALKEVK